MVLLLRTSSRATDKAQRASAPKMMNCSVSLIAELRQLHHIGCDPTRLVAREQLGAKRRLGSSLEIDIRSCATLLSRTMKQASLCSSTDQGGGKWRGGIE